MGKKGSDDASVGARVGLGEVKRGEEERRRGGGSRGGHKMQSADELILNLKSQTEEMRGEERSGEERGCTNKRA